MSQAELEELRAELAGVLDRLEQPLGDRAPELVELQPARFVLADLDRLAVELEELAVGSPGLELLDLDRVGIG